MVDASPGETDELHDPDNSDHEPVGERKRPRIEAQPLYDVAHAVHVFPRAAGLHDDQHSGRSSSFHASGVGGSEERTIVSNARWGIKSDMLPPALPGGRKPLH